MSKWARWDEQEYDELKRLIGQGLTNVEISEIMDRPRTGIVIKANRVLGGNPNYQKRITKHSHLREPVMHYFVTHTWEQTRKQFKLTESELKSLFTVGYRDPKLKHLRKDTRRHDSWSVRELRFLLTHSGVMPREWIGRKLKRGTPVCIKEKLEQLGLSSRTVNGITLSQFIKAFGERPGFVLHTKAGPGRGGTSTYFQIVPWVWLDCELRSRRLRCAKPFRQVVSTMALFQEWIHQGNALAKLKRINRKPL